jgi:hypothetical protein
VAVVGRSISQAWNAPGEQALHDLLLAAVAYPFDATPYPTWVRNRSPACRAIAFSWSLPETKKGWLAVVQMTFPLTRRSRIRWFLVKTYTFCVLLSSDSRTICNSCPYKELDICIFANVFS